MIIVRIQSDFETRLVVVELLQKSGGLEMDNKEHPKNIIVRGLACII